MAYTVIAYLIMDHIVMAYIVMAYMILAHIVKVYAEAGDLKVVLALRSVSTKQCCLLSSAGPKLR